MSSIPSSSKQVTNSHKHEPPVFISIGSFLIDAFDTPPRPILDGSPLPPHPSTSRPQNQIPPTPPSPAHSRHSSQTSQPHNQFTKQPPFPLPSTLRPDTPISTPNGSGANTPQLQFDDQPPPEHPYEYLGGGGLYALIGARLFLPSSSLKTLVDRAVGGTDLRDDLVAQAEKFGQMWVWNEGPNTQMPRARIRYEGDDRFFHPTVKPPRRSLSELLSTPLQGGQYLHLSPPFSAEDVATLQAEMQRLSSEGAIGAWKPRLVFEPTPPSCHAGQRSWLEKVAPGIHVLSPNHEELLSFYGHSKMAFTDPRLIPTLDGLMKHLLHSIGIGEGGNGILVLRCGRLGACVGTRSGGLRWFPAYWTNGEEHRVRDVTGAGNSFIGGYVAGLSLTNEDAYQAALYGTVAASFVVEQIGLPYISFVNSGDQLLEYWNGDLPSARVESLRQKWISTGLL